MNQELPLKTQIELTQPELLVINELLRKQLQLNFNENLKNLSVKITDSLLQLSVLELKNDYFGKSDAVSSDLPPYLRGYDEEFCEKAAKKLTLEFGDSVEK